MQLTFGVFLFFAIMQLTHLFSYIIIRAGCVYKLCETIVRIYIFFFTEYSVTHYLSTRRSRFSRIRTCYMKREHDRVAAKIRKRAVNEGRLRLDRAHRVVLKRGRARKLFLSSTKFRNHRTFRLTLREAPAAAVFTRLLC